MVVPAVMHIEMAMGALVRMDETVAKDQLGELEMLGDARVKEIGVTGLTDDFKKGYELGLATARVIISGNVGVMKAGLNSGEIL